jgi:hypothetical protein
MEKRYSIFSIVAGLIFTALITLSYTSEGTIEEEKIEESFDLPQVIKPIKLKKSYTWAGEVIPENIDSRERLDRELLVNSYWQSATLLNLKMANKFFPIIERVLSEEGVPDDFKYLAVAESSLRNVSSSAAAKGYWQFRKLAATEWGLEVNGEVDERYHIEKSTRAAAKYLKWLKKKFGTWSNAAASYNVGPTNFTRLQKSQGEDSYFDMNINEETSRYVYRLIAIKEIMSDPTAYGFYLDQEDLYPALDDSYIVEVESTVPSWKEFASKYGVSYRDLKYYNPWLIDTKLTVKSKKYFVRIPKNS